MNKVYTSKATKEAMDKFVEFVNGSSKIIQLAIGTGSGLFTGYVTTKVGKKAAVFVGGGIILAQVAHSKGFGSVEWTKIQEKARETNEKLNRTNFYSSAKQLTRVNTYFAAGFVGGCLIGFAAS